MKGIILSILFILLLSAAKAQNCDIGQTGMAVFNAVNTAPVSSAQTGEDVNFKFSIGNFGTNTSCTIPANTITAILDFPAFSNGVKPYIYNGPATFVSGYFTWTYNSLDGLLRGINSSPIPNGKGDARILIKVRATAPGTGESTLTLVAANGITDNTANNISSARIVVTGNALPIKLSSFTATPDNCDVLLRWTTLTEANFSHFEIEYSPDAITFVKVGSVDGKNISTGSSYTFSYTPLNGHGYYRLKLIDKDNRFEYSEVQKVTTACSTRRGIMVYPNPINYNQKLTINVSGYTGVITGELISATGQKVSGYNLINGVNELSVANLSAGIYMLYVRSGDNDVKPFKIVVTR